MAGHTALRGLAQTGFLESPRKGRTMKASETASSGQGHSAPLPTPAEAGPSAAGHVEPRRETQPLAKRVLVVGLDGATFDILNPLMDQGRMPNLKRLIETGTSGILDSTK